MSKIFNFALLFAAFAVSIKVVYVLAQIVPPLVSALALIAVAAVSAIKANGGM